jgi:hypothetical protein
MTSLRTWLDLAGTESLPAEVVDILAPWLRDDGPPPGEPTESNDPSSSAVGSITQPKLYDARHCDIPLTPKRWGFLGQL